MDYSVRNPESITTLGLASFPFARRYLGNRFFFLFLRLLRCFSSAGLPPPYYFIHMAVIGHEPNCVSTFGNLRVKRIFAPNRSLSQLITSFIGNWCQGIRPTLLLAWPVSLGFFQFELSELSFLLNVPVNFSCYLQLLKRPYFTYRICIRYSNNISI